MRLSDLMDKMQEMGYYVSDNNDFELFMPDGAPIVDFYVEDDGIYFSDLEFTELING